MKQFLRQSLLFVAEIIEIGFIAFLSVIIIRTFIVQPFLVKGASMEPNFQSGDYLLVDEISLRFRNPERGEVVVFRYPREPDTFYIKRIIGLPGETVEIRDSSVYITQMDGEEINISEDYLPSNSVTGELDPTILEEGEYFVMGDNRSYSYDSRIWGPVPDDKIVGIARLRLWPITNAAMIEAPMY